MDPIFSQQFNMPKPQPKGGMFGNGKFGVGEAIVAALNGYLAGTGNPAGAANMRAMQEMMQAKRQRQQELDDYERKRTDTQADWRAQYDYKLANPDAPNPTEYERALTASGVLPGTPEWAQHMGNYVNVRENPPYTYVDPQTGAVMMGARTPPQQSAPPGVTFTPINDGGAGSPAPRPFPY